MAWFLAQLRLPANTTFTYNLDPTTRAPAAVTFTTTTDGSWARVEIGHGTVTEAGATPVWPHIEWAYQQWTDAGQPSWDRLGLTVTTTHHTVWLDDPAGTHRWQLS